MKNKIIIAGGTGYLGSSLIKNFSKSTDEVVILTRQTKPNIKNVRYVKWDAETIGAWAQELENASVVINLTGKSVNCRYNEKNKKEIIESRVLSTLAIGRAIQKCIAPPNVWINAGSAAIFGNAGEEFKTESSETGEGFSPDVCKKWEKAFYEIDTPATRKVFLRIGMVLQLGSGVLKPFMTMVKMGFGGKIGNGNQYLTWIHEEDFINMINWIIEIPKANGIIHCASPKPVKNKDFMKELREICKVPFGFPTPEFILKIGAVIIGTEPELVLSGRRVVSEILPEHHYVFKYPDLKEALKNLITK